MTGPATTTVVPLAHALERAGEWNALHTATGASPFMSAAWHAGWQASGQDPADDPFVLEQRTGAGTVEALLPLAVRRMIFRRVPFRTLTWATGDGSAPDHVDVMADPKADLAPLASHLLSLPWNVLHLGALAEHAPGARRLADHLVAMGCYAEFRTDHRCPSIELPASWELFLGGLSSTRRETIRRKERALFKRYRVEVEAVPPERFDVGWNTLVSLHEQRWDLGGVLGGASRRAQHLPMVTHKGAPWETWLTILRVDGRPVAAWYGFASNGMVSYYQGGRDPAYRRDSVGQVLMGMMIRRAIEGGFRRFDFMRGEEAYKYTWTDRAVVTQTLIVLRPGVIRLARRTLDLLANIRAAWRSPARSPGLTDEAASGGTS